MANESKITTQLAVDIPLVQDANFRDDTNYRRYVDNQILGTQEHVVESLISGIICSWPKLSPSSAAIAIGDCVCQSGDFSSGVPIVTKATTTPIANAGSVYGIALAAGNPDSRILVALSGSIPSVYTGVTDTSGFAVLNATTARISRVATIASTDYPIGTIGPDKSVNLLTSYKGVGAPAGGGAGTPGGSNTETQYKVDASTFGGITGWTRQTSTYQGATNTRPFEIGTAITPYSTTGDIRSSNGITWYARNSENTTNARLIEFDATEVIKIGDTAATGVYFTSSANVIARTASFNIQDTSGVSDFAIFDVASSFFRLGATNPATTGVMRTSNAFTIYGRDSGNANNRKLVDWNSSNQLLLGESAVVDVISNASTTHKSQISGTTSLEVGSNYIGVGTGTLATAGIGRFANNVIAISFRNNGNTANITGILVNTADHMYVGGSFAAGTLPAELYLSANGNINIVRAATSHIVHESGSISLGDIPIVGYSTDSSPYGVHGGVAVTFVADANYTVTSVQYKFDWLEFITGSWLSGHEIQFLHPSSLARGYYKTIFNNTSFTATITTGTGSTRTLATALAQRFFFSDAGVKFAGPTFTP